MGREIAKRTGSELITNVTPASLTGTIDSDSKEGVKSLLWTYRGKPFLLDEFNFNKEQGNEIKNILLQVTEGGGHVVKGVAIKTKREIDDIDGDMFIKISQGKISMKVRCPVIIFTMIQPDMFGPYNEALYSRFLMFQYELTKSDIRRLLNGERLLDMEGISIGEPRDVIIKKRDYKKIIKEVDSIIGDRDDKDLLLRIVQDCCKIYGALGRHSHADYVLATELRLNEGQIISVGVDAFGSVGIDTKVIKRVQNMIEDFDKEGKNGKKK